MSSGPAGRRDGIDPRPDPVDDASKPGIDRRSFLGVVGAGCVGTATLRRVQTEGEPPAADPIGVLVDTTRCAGCRACEFACAAAHGLPTPDEDFSVLDQERTTSETQLSVINRYQTDKGPVTVKRQCMHCLQPACASACLTKAMYKTPEGPIVWRESRCMGCRFCMVSCPFDVPKFEYHSANPRIRKCDLCADRRAEGKEPACVANCPTKALTFGRRSELIQEARRRIYGSPDRYINRIHGEFDVGGTSWLYLAGVPFEQLGFRTDLGTEPYPVLTKEFLYGVPVVLTLLPAALLAISNATKENAAADVEEGDA